MKKKIIFITVLSACLAITATSRAQECTPACPDTFRVHHVAGTVSAETVTINYPLVETDLSGTNQCWLGRNLGATIDAASVTDNSAAAAGWYWQFNRKQGYAHDGSSRTPNTVWITSIDENTDWEPANDPCNLFFGSNWRLPTATEWTNVDATGAWGNYNDAYNSVLKLHAAGLLTLSGSLNLRGTRGYWWSHSQESTTAGRNMVMLSSTANVNTNSKVSAFSVRCLRGL